MNPQKVFIPGPLPGFNEMEAARGRGGRFGHKRENDYNVMKAEWMMVVKARCTKASIKPMAHAWVHFLWLERDRRRDKDNIAAGKKFVLDGIVKAGILPGDGWKNVVGFKDDFDVLKTRPGCMVTLYDRDPERGKS